MRFLNCEMYYTEDEIDALIYALRDVPLDMRATFFDDCQRLRRRERQVWGDTPLAKVFTAKSDWKHLHMRALMHQMSLELQRRQLGSLYLMDLFGEREEGGESFLSVTALQRMCITLKLGFSPADVSLIAQAFDERGDGRITADHLSTVFRIPMDTPESVQAENATQPEGPATWSCLNCGLSNPSFEIMCERCGFGWTGKREVPPGKWECHTCSFFNEDDRFYCDMCSASRP